MCILLMGRRHLLLSVKLYTRGRGMCVCILLTGEAPPSICEIIHMYREFYNGVKKPPGKRKGRRERNSERGIRWRERDPSIIPK